MPVNELLQQVRKALGGVTSQAVYARVKKKREEHAPISADDALALVAVDAGVDVTKYRDTESISRIRQFRVNSTPAVSPPHSPKRASTVTRNIYVGRNIKIVSDPLLSPTLLAEAKRMAEDVYPVIYVFENSVRQFILKVLERAKGPGWWPNAAPPDVQKTVGSRKVKEDRNPWHGKRGVHEIYYCDIDNLRKIVITNWPDFEPYLPKQEFFTIRIGEIEHSRNIVSHNNPLSEDDAQRVEVYFRDWQKQMEAIRHLL